MEEFSENIQKFVFIIVILSVFGFLLRHLFVDVGDNNTTSYLKNNYVKIFSMMTVLLFVIVFFNVLGFKFDKKEEPVLTGKYIVENFNIRMGGRDINDEVKDKLSQFTDNFLNNKNKSSNINDTTSTINNEINNDLLPESFWRTKGQGFCNAIIGDSEKHKEACKQLSFSNCSAFTSCCAAANGKDEESYSCVPVSTGTGQPIFNNDHLGQNIDFYWYKGKCYGEQCNSSREEYEAYKKQRLQIIENSENGDSIINEANKEQEKAESGCKSKQNTCYLWGIPDANISPFG